MLDRFKTYPVNRQILLALLLGACILALLLAGWLGMRTVYAPLFKDLRAPDAAAIVAELDRKKASYRIADEGRTVLVPSDRVDATRLELMSGDLALKGTVGFELFNKSDMGLTDFAQRINFQRAVQGELERTISTLDGVETVRVHLSLGENRIFREDRIPPKASVTVHMQHGAQLAPSAAAGVQRLVAAAVAQLEPADVVILDEAGQVISSDLQAGNGPAAAPGSQLNAIQDYYAARIRDALRPLYPENSIRMAVRAMPSMDHRALPPSHDRAALSPGARDTAIEVILELSPSLPRDAKDDVRALVTDAIDYDAGRGDRVEFGPVPVALPQIIAPRPEALPQVPQERAAPILAAAPAEGSWWIGLWFLVMLCMVAMAGALIWRLRRDRPRTLSAGERNRLIDTLNALVDDEGGIHGARQ
jgi:flagellar M-ring protein FliF